MKQDCCNYNSCRFPVQQCNNKCVAYNKTCWTCDTRIHEECGIDGHEVYPDSVPCFEYND